jgi:hypothetical protein
VSSLIINWRIWCWFLQVEPWADWARNRRNGRANVTWTRVPGRPKQGEWPVAFYQGRAYAALLILAGVLLAIWAAS